MVQLKAKKRENNLIMALFQYLMVQLKDKTFTPKVFCSRFQYLMVQLKGGIHEKDSVLEPYFNTSWYN